MAGLTSGQVVVATGPRKIDTWVAADVRDAILDEQAHIADANVAHAVASWADTNTALNALGAKINSILAALETNDVLATV